MAYKLAIADTVEVPVKFSLNSAGKARSFSFSLKCDRLAADEIKQRLDGKDLISGFMKEVVRGWQGQTLVLDEDDTPAEFSPEALDLMLGVAGVAMVVYAAYVKECGAKEKN